MFSKRLAEGRQAGGNRAAGAGWNEGEGFQKVPGGAARMREMGRWANNNLLEDTKDFNNTRVARVVAFLVV